MCVRFESKSCVYRKAENWKEVNIMEDARIVQLYWDIEMRNMTQDGLVELLTCIIG